ncbi:MAG TPA: class I SAM-dependent methyltransferase, partial [Polyangiaceae bacterium]|nr:class I SAM-dependent methyltransferase [Polyangiaceae bacterium]
MAQPSTESSIEARWGSQAVDPRGYNLPALKARYLLSRLPKSGQVLEVGSGDGKMLRTVLAELPTLSVFGCDVRDSNLRPEAAEFRTMNGVQIPFDSDAFDAVFVADVL